MSIKELANYLRPPTFSIVAYSNKYFRCDKTKDAEFFVTAWLKRNKKGKYSHYRQLVIDNYDFYTLMIFLVIEDEKHPFNKAIDSWHSELVL